MPGGYTIPEQIVKNRQPYYDALEDGDANFEKLGQLNENVVPEMENLLASMLAKQLANHHKQAVS